MVVQKQTKGGANGKGNGKEMTGLSHVRVFTSRYCKERRFLLSLHFRKITNLKYFQESPLKRWLLVGILRVWKFLDSRFYFWHIYTNP